MNTEERLARLETKVDHIQSDVTEVKADQRQLRDAMQAQGKELLELIHKQGKELHEAMNAQGASLRSEMHALVISLERFKWRFWAALVVLFVFQVLLAGGAPAAIARLLKIP